MRYLLSSVLVALAASVPAIAAENVPVPAFRNIELNGGGEVTLVPGATQRVTIVDGSSAFTRMRVDRAGRLRIDACNQRCPQHYNLRIEIQTPNIPGVGINGGGSIHAAGGFAEQDQIAAGVSGGGVIDLRTVRGGNVAVGVNGGGKVFVNARSTLAAGVNGGGEVRYLGKPQVTSAIDGGGTVRPVS
jgi:hypothetical protein